MQNKIQVKTSFLITLGLFLILIDQIIKFYVLLRFQNLVFLNYSSAFGASRTWLDFLIFFIILGLIFYLFVISNKNQSNNLLKFGLVFMISGGISNLIDKIFRGYVIDYINIKTSAFNFADIIIVVGALILIWQILYEKNLTSVKDRKKVI